MLLDGKLLKTFLVEVVYKINYDKKIIRKIDYPVCNL